MIAPLLIVPDQHKISVWHNRSAPHQNTQFYRTSFVPACKVSYVKTGILTLQAVEATAESEQFIYKAALRADSQVVKPITGYVVILSMNEALHGQNSWQGTFVSLKYQDHSAWDTETLDELLRIFFSITEASSFPSVAEFGWRVDKVSLSTSCRTLQHACAHVSWFFARGLCGGRSS